MIHPSPYSGEVFLFLRKQKNLEDMMNRNIFSIITAVIAVVFGLAMILAPHFTVSIYGSDLNIPGEFMARYFGSALLGLAVIFYLTRKTDLEITLLNSVLLGGLVFAISGLIVSIWDVIAGTHNALVWLNVVLYVFFTAGFGYYYFKK